MIHDVCILAAAAGLRAEHPHPEPGGVQRAALRGHDAPQPRQHHPQLLGAGRRPGEL